MRPDGPLAYLDHGPPTLAQALHGLREAVVLPLLLTEAYHSRVDLPAALAEARARDSLLRVRYGTTLGPHPLLLDRRWSAACPRPGYGPARPTPRWCWSRRVRVDARANAVIADLASAWTAPSLLGGSRVP
ncbi:sirohydrochlorin chelatase [Nonomuraea dietziae]|uniref:sirohydrochlorin chelatase n=1 Tax=Nonomuraea dietziae TaxID=65515 RepID=UPI00336F2085